MAGKLPEFSRRRFLLMTALGGLGVSLVAVTIWPLWRFLAPRPEDEKAEKVTVARADVSPGEAHFFKFRGRPAVLLQPRPGDFVALSAVCTHLGCILQWLPEKDEFLCPCHAGRFSADGQVIAGPPPRPLERLPVAVAGTQVVIG